MNIILRRTFSKTVEALSYYCLSRGLGAQSRAVAGCRFRSTSSSSESVAESLSDNEVNPEFVNRNPRNLERLGIARKSKGWVFQYPRRDFYHRLMFETTNRHTTGWVEHCSGRSVVTASTKEFAIGKHLYSLTDVSAAENVGRILANRCQKAGLTTMSTLEPEYGDKSAKYNAFMEAVSEGGVTLEEPEEVLPEYTPGINYEDQWEVDDLNRRQLKVRKNPRRTVFKYGQTKKTIKVKNYPD